MKSIRRLHLYFGCFFAPLLSFFAISGFWQTLHLQWKPQNHFLLMLSTLHTGQGTKDETLDLSSPVFRCLILIMAACLLLTITLGVIMALKSASRRVNIAFLALGVVVPLLIILLR